MSIYLGSQKMKFLSAPRLSHYTGTVSYANNEVNISIPGKYDNLYEFSKKFICGTYNMKNSNNYEYPFSFDCSLTSNENFWCQRLGSSGSIEYAYCGYLTNYFDENQWYTQIHIAFDSYAVGDYHAGTYHIIMEDSL